LSAFGTLVVIGLAWLISRSTGEFAVLSMLLLAICPLGVLAIGWLGRRPAKSWQRAVWFLVVLCWGSVWSLYLLYVAVAFRLRDDFCEPRPASWSWFPPMPYCPPATPSALWAVVPAAVVALPLGVLGFRRRAPG
jgi:hypothetical protein